MTRTFIAVDLDTPTRDTVAQLLRRVADALPHARVVTPDTLHITLAFLGELDDERLASATEATRAAESVAPFSLALGRVGVFGPDHAPRVIWLAIGGQERRLRMLQRQVTRALAARAFALDTRPFAPHLTLARLSAPLDETAAMRLRQLRSETPQAAPWRVDDLRVMRSDLDVARVRYTPLTVIKLRGGAGRE